MKHFESLLSCILGMFQNITSKMITPSESKMLYRNQFYYLKELSIETKKTKAKIMNGFYVGNILGESENRGSRHNT